MNEKTKRNKINKYWPGGTIIGIPAWLYDLPQRIESNKKLNQYGNRAVQFITNPNYRKHFISRHFGKKSKDIEADETFQNTYGPELTYDNAFVDLSKNAYASTGETPKDATSALTSEFMEMENPSVFTAAKWKTLPSDYMLRDWKDMPLGDISLFYGVEDGTLKIMPLDQFRDSTTIVPVRTPYGSGGLTSITGDANYDEKYWNWRDTRDSLAAISNYASWKLRNARDSTYFDRVVTPIMPKLSTYGITPDRDWFINNRHVSDIVFRTIQSEIPDSLSEFDYVYGGNPTSINPRLDSLKTLHDDLVQLPGPDNMKSPQLDSLNTLANNASNNYGNWLNNNPQPKETVITFEDGTSSHSTPYPTYGKFLLGNSHGGFYINGSSVLNNSGVRRILNNFIQTSGEPLYPAIVDNGSFAKHILDTVPQTRLIPKYLDQGYGVRPDSTNVFVIGTRTPSKKNGGILFGQEGTPLILKQNNRLNYPTYINGSCTGVGSCAAWSNQQLRDIGADIYGDAWQLSGDIQSVSNGYDNISKPQIYSRRAVESTNDSASNNIKSNVGQIVSELDPNEAYAVNMYYKGSEFLNKAFNEGNDFGTHTGMLIFNNNTGKWEVVHNIHKTLHVDDFENAVGSGKQYGVTHIYKTNIPDKPKWVSNFSEWVENESPFKFKNNNITHE